MFIARQVLIIQLEFIILVFIIINHILLYYKIFDTPFLTLTMARSIIPKTKKITVLTRGLW